MLVYRHRDNPDTMFTRTPYLDECIAKKAEISKKFSNISPEETDFFDDMCYRYTIFEIWNMSKKEKKKIWREYVKELVEEALKDWKSGWEELTVEVEEK